MSLHPLKLPLFLLTIGALLGWSQGAAQGAAQEASQEASQELDQITQTEADGQQYAQAVQACQYGGLPRAYVRIETTGSPLRVRSSPAGASIGLIPNGWAVRVLEWSRNGYWVKVTSHFDVDPQAFGSTVFFGSAPEFREGWVSAGYVKDLGRSCEKPEAAAMLLQPALFGAQPVEVQSDWLATGDLLADGVIHP